MGFKSIVLKEELISQSTWRPLFHPPTEKQTNKITVKAPGIRERRCNQACIKAFSINLILDTKAKSCLFFNRAGSFFIIKLNIIY